MLWLLYSTLTDGRRADLRTPCGWRKILVCGCFAGACGHHTSLHCCKRFFSPRRPSARMPPAIPLPLYGQSSLRSPRESCRLNRWKLMLLCSPSLKQLSHRMETGSALQMPICKRWSAWQQSWRQQSRRHMVIVASPLQLLLVLQRSCVG